MFRFGMIEILFLLILCGVPGIIAFIDVVRSDFRGNDKIVWLLSVILVPVIGPIAYFFIGRKQKAAP